MNAAPDSASYYGVKTAPYTHVNLLSGRKGREVSRSDGEVVIQCELGGVQSYDEDRLHLTWARLSNDSQGEPA